MDLHGEDPARCWERLGRALHRACRSSTTCRIAAEDHARLGRVYLPRDWLAEEGLDITVLTQPASPPGYRRLLDRLLDGCDRLIARADELPPRLKSRRLAAESRVIVTLARRLAARLRREDPLAGRVKLSKPDFALAALRGLPTLLGIAR